MESDVLGVFVAERKEVEYIRLVGRFATQYHF